MILNLVISVFAIVVSVFSLYKSYKTDKFNEVMRKYELENDLLNRINNAKSSHTALFEKIIGLKTVEVQREMYQFVSKVRLEEYLNALDYTCDKYESGVIDEESFKRNFAALMIGAFDNETTLEIIDSKDKNKYPSLKRIYNDLSIEK